MFLNNSPYDIPDNIMQIHQHVYNKVRVTYNQFFEKKYGRSRGAGEEDFPTYLRVIGAHFYEKDISASDTLIVINDIHEKVLQRGITQLGWTQAQMDEAMHFYNMILKDIQESVRIR
jgi:hypothetical protein